MMVDAATAALKAASAEAAQIKAKRVAAAAAGDVTPDKSMRDARLREQDAIDGLEIAKAAQTSISDGAPDLARDLDVARKRVEAAARAVIVGAAPELIERAKLATPNWNLCATHSRSCTSVFLFRPATRAKM